MAVARRFEQVFNLLFQVVVVAAAAAAAAVSTPMGKLYLGWTIVENVVKDFFKEEWVERVLILVMVVLVGAVVRVGLEGVVEEEEGIPGEAVEIF